MTKEIRYFAAVLFRRSVRLLLASALVGMAHAQPELWSLVLNSDDSVTVTWTGGELEVADSPTGPWTVVSGAASPYTWSTIWTPRSFVRIREGEAVSTSIAGYVTMELPPGPSFIANPLDNGEGNKVVDLFRDVHDGISVTQYDSSNGTLATSYFDGWFSQWTVPDMVLEPGEGAVLYNPSSEDFAVVLDGLVPSGLTTNAVPKGLSLQASTLPQAGALVTDLGYPVSEGEIVYLFAEGGYSTFIYDSAFGGWQPGEPQLKVGESFLVRSPDAKVWTRNLTATP